MATRVPVSEVTVRDGADATDGAFWSDCVQRVAAGDQAALDALFAGTRARVFAIVRRMLPVRADAEEVVSDVYVQLWRTAHRFDPARSTAIAWLTVIARTRALDRCRTLRRHASVMTSTDGQPFGSAATVEQYPSTSLDPEQSLLRRRRHLLVRSAVRSLDPQQRGAIRMTFLEGRSHREVSAHLRVPLGTVKSRVRAGVRMLTPALQLERRPHGPAV